MSFGVWAGSSAVSRHASVRSQLPIGQHAHRQQMVKKHSVISAGRQRATLRCKSLQDEQTSVDEQERQKSSLSASCSGEEGKLSARFNIIAHAFPADLRGESIGLICQDMHQSPSFGNAEVRAQSESPQERWQLASWLHSSRQSAKLRLLGIAGASAGLLGAPPHVSKNFISFILFAHGRFTAQ